MKNKRIAMALTIAVFLGTISYRPFLNVLATSGQADPEEETQSMDDLEEDADALDEEYEQLQDDLAGMNSDLVDISASIAETQDAITAVQEQIAATESQLSDAQASADEQYASMKLRIQYMYENESTSTLWNYLFEAEDFGDFLSHVQYITELAQTDRRLLEEYETTLAEIADTKAALEEQEAALEEQEATLADQEESLRSSISGQEGAIALNEERQAEIDAQIAALEEYERQLEEEAAKSANKSDPNDPLAFIPNEQQYELIAQQEAAVAAEPEREVAPQDGEAALFAALIYCEAGGEPYETQLACASVVVNRVNSANFPNTITEVIYQTNQFTPARSGRLALALEGNKATESCWNAVNAAMAGDVSGDWLFFRNDNGLIEGTVIGSMIFY